MANYSALIGIGRRSLRAAVVVGAIHALSFAIAWFLLPIQCRLYILDVLTFFNPTSGNYTTVSTVYVAMLWVAIAWPRWWNYVLIIAANLLWLFAMLLNESIGV